MSNEIKYKPCEVMLFLEDEQRMALIHSKKEAVALRREAAENRVLEACRESYQK